MAENTQGVTCRFGRRSLGGIGRLNRMKKGSYRSQNIKMGVEWNIRAESRIGISSRVTSR